MSLNLLIITQKVDSEDENLGFFHAWVEEFSLHADQVTVIASSVGKHHFGPKVKVFSLGKESGMGRIRRIYGFFELFSRLYIGSDAVFFHMIPEFVLAASPFLVSLKKPTALWYTHKSVTRKLKIAEWLVDVVFTASPLSFRLPSKKVIITGHAIDTGLFRPTSDIQQTTSNIRLLSAGRMSPSKDLELLIRACILLKKELKHDWHLSLVGGPIVPGDTKYIESLEQLVKDAGLASHISFFGPQSYSEMPKIFRKHDICINLSKTGSVDKAVLEAMASGLTVITANEAFADMLPERYFLAERSVELLSRQIQDFVDEKRPNQELRDLVMEHHSLKNTIQKIVEVLNSYN